MRDIKFRAWVKQSKRMEPSVGVNPFYVSDLDRYNWPHDDVELMQFTGLKDSAGSDIYEGDVLQYTMPDIHSGDVEYTEVVSFLDGCFVLDGYAPAYTGIETGVVIGNIYENPQLIN